MLRSSLKLIAVAGLAVTLTTAESAFAGKTGIDRVRPGTGFHARHAGTHPLSVRSAAPQGYAAPQYFQAPRGLTAPVFGSLAARPAAPGVAVPPRVVYSQPRVIYSQPRVVSSQPGRVIYRSPVAAPPAPAPVPQAQSTSPREAARPVTPAE